MLGPAAANAAAAAPPPESVFLTLFPQGDYTLLAVIIGLPLLGAFVNGVFGKRLGPDAVRLMALFSIGLSFVASVIAFITLDKFVEVAEHVDPENPHVKLAWTAWEWMRTTGKGANIPIQVRFSIDALSGV